MSDQVTEALWILKTSIWPLPEVAIWTVTAENPLYPALPALFQKEFKSQSSEWEEWTRSHEKDMKHLNKKENRAKYQQSNDESSSKASLHIRDWFDRHQPILVSD